MQKNDLHVIDKYSANKVLVILKTTHVVRRCISLLSGTGMVPLRRRHVFLLSRLICMGRPGISLFVCMTLFLIL